MSTRWVCESWYSPRTRGARRAGWDSSFPSMLRGGQRPGCEKLNWNRSIINDKWNVRMGKLKNRKMEEWNGKWANDMKKNLMVGSSFIYILHFSFHSSISQFLHSNILPFFMFSSSWGVDIHIRLSSRLRSTSSFSRGLYPERSRGLYPEQSRGE